jgi:hypothetical protein
MSLQKKQRLISTVMVPLADLIIPGMAPAGKAVATSADSRAF